MLFSGVLTAIVTPFRDGKVDEEAYRSLIEWQIAEGVDGIVPCGTTGESATLSHAEHQHVIEVCLDQVKGRVKVLAGAGSNCTAETIKLATFAKQAGADGALLITPYYNKPTQEGLYQHFATVAKAVDIPLVPYNVPGRTGVNMLPATLARLAKDYPNVVGVKEATSSMQQGSEIVQSCPEGFAVLSGDDFTALPLWAVGGVGVISVTSNIRPRAMKAMWSAFQSGNLAEARRIHNELFPLHAAMFIESNPIPVKTSLALMGIIGGEMRLPLYPMSAAHEEQLKAVLKAQGLI